jgi:hypothetical protein
MILNFTYIIWNQISSTRMFTQVILSPTMYVKSTTQKLRVVIFNVLFNFNVQTHFLLKCKKKYNNKKNVKTHQRIYDSYIKFGQKL